MTSFEIGSVFWDKTAYWKELDSTIDRYKGWLEDQSTEQEALITQRGDETSALIAERNKEYSDNLRQYKEDTDNVYNEYKTSTEQRRADSDQLVKNQTDAANLEANITAAKWAEGWRLSVSQITAINTDITNQFATSINNAEKDNIAFQTNLDDKLANMWFTVIDKQRVLDEFQKVLSDEEAAPLLDAIADKYATREWFLTALWDTINGINKAQVDDSAWRILRSERLTEDEAAFNNMSDQEKGRDIIDRLWVTWNILTDTQRQQIINDTVSGEISYRETLAKIKNYKDQGIHDKALQQGYMWAWEDDDKKTGMLDASWISTAAIGSTTEAWRVYTWKWTANQARLDDEAISKAYLERWAAQAPTANTDNTWMAKAGDAVTDTKDGWRYIDRDTATSLATTLSNNWYSSTDITKYFTDRKLKVN